MIALLLLLAAGAAQASADGPATPSQPCSRTDLRADIHACDAALGAEKDPLVRARILYDRAFIRNETEKYQEALTDLDAAAELDPANLNVLHERGYTLNALGRYEKAVADLDRQVSATPAVSEAYQERAYARHFLGDLKGAYEDWDKVARLRPADPDALLARANAALWLGRFDQAMGDVEAAARLAGASDSSLAGRVARRREEIGLWRKRSSSASSPASICTAADKAAAFGQADLIGDCTAAFMGATTAADKAAYLTIRSTAWLIGRQDSPSSLADQQIAVALDPNDARWRSNLGFAYARAHHSAAALQEFNRSLAIAESWTALYGRSTARYNLGDKAGALADAKRSFELHPSDAAAMIVGDLVMDSGDKASARRQWLVAYRLGDRDDALLARLKSIGIDHPEQEPNP
jgi:tetratricopeptide (TPR) repeat protein